LILGWILAYVGDIIAASEDTQPVGATFLDTRTLIFALLGILGTWIEAALIVKRLHDLNATGWLIIFLYALKGLTVLEFASIFSHEVGDLLLTRGYSIVVGYFLFVFRFVLLFAPVLFVLAMVALFLVASIPENNKDGPAPGLLMS